MTSLVEVFNNFSIGNSDYMSDDDDYMSDCEDNDLAGCKYCVPLKPTEVDYTRKMILCAHCLSYVGFCKDIKITKVVECLYCQSYADISEPNSHTFEHCPRLKCIRCLKYGHIATVCKTDPSEIFCNYCKSTGHNIDSCYKVKCSSCRKIGHTAWRCNTQPCENCGLRHHTKWCWYGDKIPCTLCNSMKHQSTSCDECSICHKYGHSKIKCPNAICLWCKHRRPGKHNHHILLCKFVICNICGKQGHAGQVCRSRNTYIKR